jgi:hypothetical protein
MARLGWRNKGQQSRFDEIDNQVALLARRGRLQPRPATNLQASFDAHSKGAQISFEILSLQGIESFVVLRNFSRDIGAAKVLTTIGAKVFRGLRKLPATITTPDTDQSIAGKKVYYWVRVIPVNDVQNAVLLGPVLLDASADPGVPNVIADFAMSHQASSGGQITVNVSIKPPVNDQRWASTKIYVAGYNGVAAKVALAQAEGTTFSFSLLPTGETPTFTAISVSATGKEAASGPTKTLTLNTLLTVPAKVMNTLAIELGRSGVQISWANGPEPLLTQFRLYRGLRNAGFGAASQIATPAWSSSTSRFSFLDTSGLTGAFEWYLVAENATGLSAASDAIQTFVLNTTANIVPQSAGYAYGGASPLSAATGGSADHATVNIGSFTMKYPFGTRNYGSGAVTPLQDATKYYIYCDDSDYSGGPQTYLATTDVTVINSGEGRLYIDSITTPAFGGGGTSGSGGGGGGPCFSPNVRLKGKKRISKVRPGKKVWTNRGRRMLATLLIHWYEGPMFDMGNGELVTPNHKFVVHDRVLVAAKYLFTRVVHYRGEVWNLEIDTAKEEERNYVLANGWTAHNSRISTK